MKGVEITGEMIFDDDWKPLPFVKAPVVITITADGDWLTRKEVAEILKKIADGLYSEEGSNA